MCPRGHIGWSQTLPWAGVGLKSRVWSQMRGADESAHGGESWLGVNVRVMVPGEGALRAAPVGVGD